MLQQNIFGMKKNDEPHFILNNNSGEFTPQNKEFLNGFFYFIYSFSSRTVRLVIVLLKETVSQVVVVMVVVMRRAECGGCGRGRRCRRSRGHLQLVTGGVDRCELQVRVQVTNHGILQI